MNSCGGGSAPIKITVPGLGEGTGQLDGQNENALQQTGISELSSVPATLEVYPNPNTGTFSLLLSSATKENAVMVITNIVGQKVMELPIISTNETIPVTIISERPAGIYIITVITQGGNKYVAKMTVNP